MTTGDDLFRKRDATAAEPGATPPPIQPPNQPPPGYGYPPGYPPPGYPPPGCGYGYPPPYGQPAGVPPPGNLGWAITAVVFFWPLAIAAFINYGKVDSLWYRGDAAGAQRASEAVKRYGIIALCIGIGFAVLWIGLFATVFTAASGGVQHACVSVGGGSC